MRTIMNLLIALCLLQFNVSTVAEDSPSNGIVLDLQFNEAKGSKTVDSSPSEATCLLVGKPEWVLGHSGHAVKFSDKSQYMKITPAKNFKLPQFTFECWLKPNKTDDYDKITQGIFIAPQTVLWKSGFGIQLKCGTISIIMNCGEKRSIPYISRNANGRIAPGVWSHIAVSYDGQILKAYVNGKGCMEYSVNKAIAYNGKKSSAMRLGNFFRQPFNGVIDEVKLYNQALTENEIGLHCGKNLSCAFQPIEKYRGESPTGEFYFTWNPEAPKVFKKLDRLIGFTGKPYNQFTEDEFKAVEFSLKNLTDKAIDATLEYKIQDWRNNIIKEKSLKLNLPASGDLKREIDLETGKKGCFLLTLTVSSNGEQIYKTSESYAVTVKPDPNSAKKDSPFGKHLSDGCWTHKIMPPINTSCTRIWNPSACWNVIEAKKGTFNWKEVDFFIDHCEKANQDVLFTLAYSPVWASKAPDVLKQDKEKPLSIRYAYIGRYPPENLQDWENFVRQAVRRYKGKVKWWEVWNEVDSGYFMGTPEEYLPLLKSAYKVLKEEDPDCTVVGIAGTAHWYQFTKAFFELGGYKYMDVLSIHLYLQNPPEKSRLLPTIKAAKKLIKATGKKMPIWDTESAYVVPLRRDIDNWIYDLPTGNKKLPFRRKGKFRNTLGERRAAAYTVRQYVLEIANGISKIFLFDQYSTSNDYSLNLVANEAMVKYLTGKTFVRKIPLGDDNLYAYLFKEGDQYLAVLWAADLPSDVLLNCHSGSVVMSDFLGNEQAVKNPEKLRLSLSDYPIYLINCGPNLEQIGHPFKASLKSKAVQGNKLTVELNNSSGEKAAFSLKLLDPEHKLIGSSEKVIVNEQGIKNVSVNIPEDALTGDGQVKIIMEQGTAPAWTKTIPVRILSPPLMVTKNEETVVDGVLDEWENLTTYRINKDEQVKIGAFNPTFFNAPHWNGKEDLSAIFCLKWAEKGLWVACDVTDNNITINREKKRFFLGDSVELFLDFRGPADLGNAAYGPGVMHIAIAPPEKSKPAEAIMANKLVHADFESQIKVGGKRSLHGYAIEVFIPFSEKLLKMAKPGKGSEFGIDFAVNDADSGENQGKRKVQIIYHGTAKNFRDASDFCTMTFQE